LGEEVVALVTPVAQDDVHDRAFHGQEDHGREEEDDVVQGVDVLALDGDRVGRVKRRAATGGHEGREQGDAEQRGSARPGGPATRPASTPGRWTRVGAQGHQWTNDLPRWDGVVRARPATR